MFLKIEHLNKVSTLEVVQFVRDSAHTIREVCRKANSSVNEAALFSSRSYTFLKIEHLNKVSTLEVVQFVRDSAHTIREVCRKANSSVNEAALFSSRSYTFDFSLQETAHNIKPIGLFCKEMIYHIRSSEL